jgi:hypothetical protein
MLNESVGGMSSKWGAKKIKEILKENPEFHFNLTIIAWGMNDSSGKLSPRKYIKNIKIQMKLIQRVNPQAEFILIASSLPNPNWDHAHADILDQYEAELQKLAKKSKGRIAVANLTHMWHDILKCKSYYDLTGNGINHPNDFGHTIYAHVLAGLLK